MAQIIPIVSDALQATIRRLLPSQNGFGEDLQAQNVIVPIIDLTPSAEGSAIGTDLQTALAFGSQSAFNAANATVIVANVPGFYRVFGAATVNSVSGSFQFARFALSNGLSSKIIWEMQIGATTNGSTPNNVFDFNVFLDTGDALDAQASSETVIGGSSRQIATKQGELINPSGFTVS